MTTTTMRNTKIICTLGPASETPEKLREMILAGTSIFRLNMSHAQHDWVRKIVPSIRSIAAELDTQVGILLDTQGPAVRTGDLGTKLDLKIGENRNPGQRLAEIRPTPATNSPPMSTSFTSRACAPAKTPTWRSTPKPPKPISRASIRR